MSAGPIARGLARLSDRERRLLGLLALVVVPVAVVFLAVMPMLGAKDRAVQSVKQAEVSRDWVADQVRSFPANAEEMSGGDGAPAVALSLSEIEESLVSAGLRDAVRQLSDRPEGGIDLGFDAVPFGVMGDWLTGIAPVWGYDVQAFRIEAATPGLVNASFELVVAQ